MRKYLLSILMTTVVSLSFGQDMVKVEGGAFMMGSSNYLDNYANPPHSVSIGTFSIEKYLINFELWTEVSFCNRIFQSISKAW